MHRFGAVFQPHQIAPNRAIERITASTPLAHQLMYALYIRVAVQGGGLVLHLNIAIFNFQTMHKVRLTLSEPHCSNGVAVISTAQMSFRGVKRRGNPLNRNKNRLTIATNRISPSRLLPRREFALSVQARTRTPATVAPNYMLGESRAGHPHPIELHSSPRHSEQCRGI